MDENQSQAQLENEIPIVQLFGKVKNQIDKRKGGSMKEKGKVIIMEK